MEENKNFKINPRFAINLSEYYKTFSYTPILSGSKTITRVLSHFQFNTYELKDSEITLKSSGPSHIHSHYQDLFKGHEDYKILMSAINPYKFFSSLFESKIYYNKELMPSNITIPGIFNEFIFDNCYNTSSGYPQYSYVENISRPIDYIIKIETIEKDMLTIPWVTNSHINTIGGIKKILNDKSVDDYTLSLTKFGFPEDCRSLYTQKTADIVYKKYSKYFEVCGYDKDSWKI
jgi:hypothetical protein